MIGNAPLVLLASASAPYNSLNELIQMARAKPGTFSYGSVGAGTPGHLSAVALTMGTKLDMTHIPYKGVGPLLTDLMTDRIQLFFSSASAAMPHIKGGKLKALAVTSPQRMKSLPQVPTVAEATLPGFSYSLWGGLFAPADTPAAIVQSLNREVNAIMASTEIHNRFVAEDLAVPKNTVAEFTEFVRTEAAKFEKVVKDANIKID
jgi:tripartite-type tricarboxylate transporter receptor subunit TctC